MEDEEVVASLTHNSAFIRDFLVAVEPGDLTCTCFELARTQTFTVAGQFRIPTGFAAYTAPAGSGRRNRL